MMLPQAIYLAHHEKTVKRKSKRWAIFFILLLLLLLFFPFITERLQDEQQIVGILIDFPVDEKEERFDNSSSSSAERSSARAASAAAETNSEEAPAETTPTETPPQPEPSSQPETSQPKTSNVTPLPSRQTSPLTESTPQKLNFESMLENLSKNAKVETVSAEVVEVADDLSSESIDEIAEYFKNSSRGDKKSKTSGAGTSEASGSENPDSGNSATPGEGESGSSDNGSSNSDGKSSQGDQGTGTSPGDGIDFDGKINRPVKHREDFKGIAKKDGRIVISLCINRDGKVIYAKANRTKSSYKDSGTLRMAESIVKKNRYERDYTAAERQCGTYTYIIKGVNE